MILKATNFFEGGIFCDKSIVMQNWIIFYIYYLVFDFRLSIFSFLFSSLGFQFRKRYWQLYFNIEVSYQSK